MCANYRPPRAESLPGGLPLPEFRFGECYPGGTGPFLANADREHWLPGTFGLLPGWAKPGLAKSTYNARSETVAEKPSFRNAWRKRQLAIIPVQAFYEPCYESGKAVRWRIERTDGRPFGLAGLWEARAESDGAIGWSFTLLTINADNHPLMQRFHKPADEKRSVVVVPDAAWDAWLEAGEEGHAREFLRLPDPEELRAEADPRGGAMASGRLF